MAAINFLLHRLRLSSFHRFTVAAPWGHRSWCSATSSLEWREKEEKIARDIEPIVKLTMHILYSPRYMNGEILSMEDERAVVENILIFHPDYEDTVGSGLNAVMMFEGYFHHECGLDSLAINGTVEEEWLKTDKWKPQGSNSTGAFGRMLSIRFGVTLHKSKFG